MTNIEALIKFVERLIDNATETDDDGVEYFKDLNIPACEITDLHERVIKAKAELKSNQEERVWQMFKNYLSTGHDNDAALRGAITATNWYNAHLKEK